MNELLYNFMNQVEDVNRVKEMTVEEFTKLVKSNKLISEEDAAQLIESFKKISSNKNAEDGADDADQRKKKYRDQHKHVNIKNKENKQVSSEEKEKDDKSIER